MTPLEYIEKLHSLVISINSVLTKYGISEQITLSDITVTEKTVTDCCKKNSKLSDLIINSTWPSIQSATVYHYTSKEAAESILNSGIFRLTNIAKRYDEGEIISFCKTHKLDGYLEEDSNGTPKYRTLIMPNTFYASFTDTNLSSEQEEYFWSAFGACDGVRLTIDIQASNSNFRKIHYEIKNGEPIPLLYELTELIRKNYGLEFVLKGISRLCSFYLSGDYSSENEYRTLHRTWEGGEIQPKGEGSNSFIEIPLNQMSKCGYKFKITEVHANEKIDMPASYLFSKREG